MTQVPAADPYHPPSASLEPDAHRAFQRARLRMLLAVMFCYLFYYTGRQTFGFAIPKLQAEFGFSKTTLGWCSSAMLWAYALGQAVNGQLADRFGGRRMMSIGALVSCGLNWLVSLGSGLGSIAGPWAVNGYFQSMGWAPGSRILSNWWEKSHRGVVYGCYVFAAGSGTVVAYLAAASVVDWGWRWIFRLPVLLLLLGAFVFWLVARDRPSELGFADLPPEAGEKGHHEPESVWARYRVALGNLPFLFGSFSIGCQNLARYGLIVWVPVYFLGEGWDKEASGKWLSMALPMGMAVGAVSSGWLSDRVFGGNRSRVIVIFLLCAALCSGGLWFLPRQHFLVLPALFFTGFFVYGPQAGYWALCPDLLGKRHAGTGTGVMNFFAYAFAGFGEPTIGYLIDHNSHGAQIAFVVVAVACLAGMALMLFVRR